MKKILIAFRRLLASLARRQSRIENEQILANRDMRETLGLILANQEAIMQLFKPQVVVQLERLPETAEMVRRHDEWIREEEQRKRALKSGH